MSSYQPAGQDLSAAQPNSRTRRSGRVSQSVAKNPSTAAPTSATASKSTSSRMASPPANVSASASASTSATATTSQRRQSRKRAASLSISNDARPSSMKNAKVPKSTNVVLTKTGRLSKALKGVKVHECNLCGKVYSRAEHLRRHQHNHRTSPLQCKDCNRAFFREDLLSRHISKYHNPNGDQTNTGAEDAAQSQRSSAEPQRPSASSEGQMSTQNTRRSKRTDSSFSTAAIDDSNTNKQVPPLLSDPSQTSWSTDVGLPQQSWDPVLIPSSSAVPTTWIQPQPYQVPTLTTPGFVEATDPYPFSNFEWSGLTSLQSPVSDSAPIWDQQYYLDLDMAGLAATRSSPAPISAVPPLLMPVASHGSEEGLQDPQMGLMFSKDRQRTYLDAYWRCFHPKFPILHQRKFSSYKGLKGLLMAIMAVGAQFTQDMFAATDSRILLERCLDALVKNKHHPSNMPLEFMQAIVLLEFLYHFKARRAPDHLSEMFIAVYDKLWDMHTNVHTKATMDALHDVTDRSADYIQKQWLQWIDIHSKERLLAACYILDARHALLLGRQNHMSPMSGLNLYAPLPNVVWDVLDSTRWAQTVSGTNLTSVYIIELLDALQTAKASRCDIFTSLILNACYSASSTCQRSSISFEFMQPSHLLFGACSHLLPGLLSNCSSARIMTLAVEMINLVPFRALIATASESWFFSKRLAGDAGSAAEEFARLKQEMRAWTSGTPQVPLFNSINSVPSHPAGSLTQAVSLALQIVKEAVSASNPHLILVFGPDLALYFAALVLWAATFAATPNTDFPPPSRIEPPSNPSSEQEQVSCKTTINQFVTMAPNTILAPILRSQSSPSVLSIPQPQFGAPPHHSSLPGTLMDMSTAQHFVPMTVPSSATLVTQTPMPLTPLPLTHSTSSIMPMAGMNSTSIIRPDMIGAWRSGVEAIFKWTAWMIAAPAQQNSGAGELLEGAVGVLEKLGTDGWVGQWF